jgi:hypothetical protein
LIDASKVLSSVIDANSSSLFFSGSIDASKVVSCSVDDELWFRCISNLDVGTRRGWRRSSLCILQLLCYALPILKSFWSSSFEVCGKNKNCCV